MADWVEGYQDRLDFGESIIGRSSSLSSRKPEILMPQQLWEDIKVCDALSAELSVAMDIAEDDRRG